MVRRIKEEQSDYSTYVPYKKPEEAPKKQNNSLTIIKTKKYVKSLLKATPQIRAKDKEFRDAKLADPQAPFGSSDKPFSKSGNYSGFSHAHLNHDLSIVYKIDGNKMYLYGIFSHDDLGTGTPANINKQKSMGSSFVNMTENRK